jgi:hypothetical protein
MALVAFQVTCAATGVAQQLPSNPVLNSVTIKARGSNVANISVGSSSAVVATTGYVLEKTQSVTIPLRSGNTNEIWVVGTAADVLSIIEA